MHKIVILIFFLTSLLNAQSNGSVKNTFYLEDQIYIGISYITFINKPSTVELNGFSNSFSLGFIKDIPVNKNGDFAFGLGLGYGRNTYYQNIKISEINNSTQFQIAEPGFNNNKFSTHVIEVPFEIRWRTSTIDKYKFWRIYAGSKLSYVFSSNSKFKEDGNTIRIVGISEINKWQYGLTVSVGHGTWNFNIYYGLTDIFSNAILNDNSEPVKIKDIRVGLMFYIL